MSNEGVVVLVPREPTAVIASIAHGGREFPVDLADELIADPESLWSDWYTPDLYSFTPTLGITTIINRLSRFVADPNRDPEGPRHGSFWTSVVASTDPWHRPLYRRPLTDAEIDARLSRAHQPFHAALVDAVEQVRDLHGEVLLLDLHSFGMPLDADVVIGDRSGRSGTRAAVELVEQALEAESFRTARNRRWPGGWIVRRFEDDRAVDALQLELDLRTYLQPLGVEQLPTPPPLSHDAMAAARQRLTSAFVRIVDRFPPTSPRRRC
ncbi:MAG: N-formylglutamate amidohydrolase [Actinomycetota bacterium]|nr:N-formylglutamate amidohydrolase [Actinomycetota bacterium]